MEIGKFKKFCDTHDPNELVKLKWVKSIKLKTGEIIKKYSEGIVKLGLKYGDLKKPGDPYVDKDTLWVIKDYVKCSNKNNLLLMVYPDKNVVETSYKDKMGSPICVDDIISNMYDADKPKHLESMTVFTINLNNLIEIS